MAPYKFIGFAALSVERAITCLTSFSNEALITFSAPCMFVFIHSNGLYSEAGTCFIAAAWITKSTPRNACFTLSASRTSPIKKRIWSCGNCSLISNCFSSSLEKIINLSGLYFCRIVFDNFLPNDPVPPVIRIDLLSNINVLLF